MRKIILIVLLILTVPEISSQVRVLSETCLTHNSFDDRYGTYAPDGKAILFESNRDGNWEIYLMNNDGTDQKRLTFDGGNDRRPSWHPDGKKIVFESDRTGQFELYVLQLADKQLIKLTNTSNGVLMFARFSPEGNTIAASLKVSENQSNIVLLNHQGQLLKYLTENDFRNFYPRWSRDGKEIIYFSRKETQNEVDEIYRLNLQLNDEQRLTNWPKHNFCPAWSKENDKMVYVTSMERSRPELYVMNADGQQKTRLTYNEDGDTLPDWSPVTNKILFTGYRNGNFQLCELELQIDPE